MNYTTKDYNAKQIIKKILLQKQQNRGKVVFVEMSADIYDFLLSEKIIVAWKDVFPGAVVSHKTICGLPIKVCEREGYDVVVE